MGRSSDDEQMRLKAYSKRKLCAFLYLKEDGTHVEEVDHARSDSEGDGHSATILLEHGLLGNLVRIC